MNTEVILFGSVLEKSRKWMPNAEKGKVLGKHSWHSGELSRNFFSYWLCTSVIKIAITGVFSSIVLRLLPVDINLTVRKTSMIDDVCPRCAAFWGHCPFSVVSFVSSTCDIWSLRFPNCCYSIDEEWRKFVAVSDGVSKRTVNFRGLLTSCVTVAQTVAKLSSILSLCLIIVVRKL